VFLRCDHGQRQDVVSKVRQLTHTNLYKQAVCGPCTVPRPGFWDPVGRYKWWVCVYTCACQKIQ
uniref:ACB domain-containing protein n=1 Tax=Pundamilia nyererei TaxID=303518 RepID=A0A3B4H3V3_9CICH